MGEGEESTAGDAGMVISRFQYDAGVYYGFGVCTDVGMGYVAS
jgi:hypothetical protein